MQKKSVLPFATVLTIGALWTILTRSGGDGILNVPGENGSRTSLTVQGEPEEDHSSVDEAQEKRIEEILTRKDVELEKLVNLHSVVCNGRTCTIEASPKSDPILFRTSLETLLQEYPGLGSRIETQTITGQALAMKFIVHYESMPAVD
jgi:hypothetical protein